MKKTLLCAALLAAVNLSAQDFEWQWAKRGGGIKQSSFDGDTFYNFDSEQIIDIAVDEDNNYYFLSYMTQQDTEFDGTPVTVYNYETGNFSFADVVLISTDCEGTLRWTQTIGGTDRDDAHKIVLDNNGGLYLAANITNVSGPEPNTYTPPHFSPDDALPVLADNTGVPQEGYKTAALLKYNTNDGSLVWRVMPQGDVTFDLRASNINEVILDSEGNLHTLIGFKAGTHLNGEVTVPGSFTADYKYYIVKFNTNGNFISALPLSLEGRLLEFSTQFRYDENLGRYYLSGFRGYGGSSELFNLTFNGTAFTDQAYILAFSETGSEIWRKESSSVSEFKDSRIYDLDIDSDSNIYIAGKYLCDPGNPGVSLGTYQFPENIGGNVVFIMKLNAEGQVQWNRIPTGYNLPQVGNIFTGSHFAYDLLINGSQVAIATQISNEIWGDFTFSRPTNHRSDPAIMFLDKTTGVPLAVHDVLASSGYDDAFTAIEVDNDGNYIAGGYFIYNLFTAQDDNVPTLNKVQDQILYTDFFIAKFAATPCGTPVAGINDVEAGEIYLYPNPSSGLVNIQTDAVITNYSIVNSLGQVVAHGNIDAGSRTVSVQNLGEGVYIINLTTQDNGVITKKIIKE